MSQKSSKRVHKVDENDPDAPKRQMQLSPRKRPALSAIDVNSQDVAGPSELLKRRRVSVNIPQQDEEHASTASASTASIAIESPEPPPQQPQPGLTNLPDHFTDKIFAMLDFRSIKAATEASSVLNRAFQGSSRLNDVNLCIDCKDLLKSSQITRSYKSIKIMNLVDSKFERRFIKRFERNFVPWIGHSVKEIELNDSKLTNSQLIRILRLFPNVESLVLRKVEIDDTMPVAQYRIPKLRRVECDIVGMITLIQDFLVDCQNLEEVSVRGSYRRSPNFVINPTIDVFSVLRPLIMRQKNLRTLEIADSGFFSSDTVQRPPFQLRNLFLSMTNVSNFELSNLYGFLRSQREIGKMKFNITLESNGRQLDFERSLDYVLNMPSLVSLSLVIYSGIGMRHVFRSHNVNNNVRGLAVNLKMSCYPDFLERIVQRYPIINALRLMNRDEGDINSANILRPLGLLRNLRTLDLKRFSLLQVTQLRCPQVTSLRFEPVDDDVRNFCSFLIAHPQLRDFALHHDGHPAVEFNIKSSRKK